ncbi:hypothetical protein [Jeotgalibacillus marinus]|uniref:Alkaliphily related protein n=1 Tax=Jeotgalibacillus marinus TaxID=86667 RepID=A0ABV3Q6M1_9BACL
MTLGVILTITALLILLWQLKKPNENRNVVILFFAFVMALFGLWAIFDWVMFNTWLV